MHRTAVPNPGIIIEDRFDFFALFGHWWMWL